MSLGWQQQEIPWENGALVLQASTTASSANWDATTPVQVGRGDFWVSVVVTAVGWVGSPKTGSQAAVSSPDLIIIDVEANTASATTSWSTIGCLALGDESGTGRDRAFGVDTYLVGCKNNADNQIRHKVYLNQSVSSLTYSSNAYPMVPLHK